MSTYIDPYKVEAHIRWVHEGRCPSIHSTKAWCNGHLGHGGAHWAPFFGERRHRTWTDAEAHPR